MEKKITCERYEFCTNCNQEVDAVDTLEQYGQWGQWGDFRCPICDRGRYDMYDDKKGLEFRERNYKTFISINDVKEALSKLREEVKNSDDSEMVMPINARVRFLRMIKKYFGEIEE